MTKRSNGTLAVFIALAAAVLAAPVLASCASAPEAAVGWRGAESTGGGTWELAVSETDAAVFATDRVEQAVVFGEAFPEADGSWVFHIDGVRWFESRINGWTEASFAAYGSLRLIPVGRSWKAEIVERPVIDGVAEAEILYRRKGHYGDRAVDIVRRRWLRSLSVADHLRSLPDADGGTFGEPGRSRRSSASETFAENVGPRLFPEIYGPPKGRRKADAGQGSWAEGVRWDTSYTEAAFPPELHEVRNSGTLLRDFEESPGLIYLAYLWPWMWDFAVPQSKIETRS